MPYALMLKWFLGGGWLKCLEGLAVVALVSWGALWLHNYHAMQAKAAQTDALTHQLSDEHTRLGKALDAQHEAEVARDAYRKALDLNDKDRAAYFAALARKNDNAPVRVNPLCWPTAADRRVRNDAARRFGPGFGEGGVGSGLPAVAAGDH